MYENVIEMTDVRKSFDSEEILKGINFSVNKGDIAVINGASGQGKTTMIKIMLGLEEPDSGNIFFFGQDIKKTSKKESKAIKLKTGVSFQNNAIFDSNTVFDNVSLPLKEHTKMSKKEIENSVMNMLDLMDISGTEEKYPAQLSGGMQKRVGLARALIMNPEILILDEPTTGLDDELIGSLYDTIAQLKNKLDITAVIITHYFPGILGLADCVAFMHGGIITKCIPASEFQAQYDPEIARKLENLNGPIIGANV